MRAGVACTVQPALATESAALVRQSVSLARRRGHAQVTPLHVATAMLSSPAGLLRAACLLAHSHPLHFKALDLCFNVALNRLPATSPSIPTLRGHPAISNALVAAFKRAQAHQRRGFVAENQQQPLLAVKIELDQLIISILDDPSVSRVMREAGFSSTQVKSNIEKALIPPDACASTTTHPVKAAKAVESEDAMGTVLEILSARKKKSIVVVRDSLPAAQAAVKRLMDMVNRGEVPENLRDIQFVTIILSTFVNMSVDEVRQKVAELRRRVRSCFLERSDAVLYIGDLNWTADYWCSGEKRKCSYCPVETILREISKLAFGDDDFVADHETGNVGDLWLLSAATHQTYLGCRIGNPSLEILLGLHPLPIPAAGSLDFILHHDGEAHSRLMGVSKIQDGTFSMGDGPRFHSEIQTSNPATRSTVRGPLISSNLPSWLRVHQEVRTMENSNVQAACLPPKDQCRYWNFMGNSISNHYSQHHRLGRTLSFSSASPISSPSFHEPNSLTFFHTRHTTWPISAPTSRACSPEHDGEQSTAIDPAASPSSCSDAMDVQYVSRFRELSAQNLKILCIVLDREIPRHKEIIPDLASTILQCRSGMLKSRQRRRSKEDTWLLFEGNDREAKERLARGLALAIFGSRANYISIDHASDRSLAQFFAALLDNPHRVIVVDNVDTLDNESRIRAVDAIVRGCWEEEGFGGDAIIILCCKSFEFGPRRAEDEEEEIRNRACLDLNLASRSTDQEEKINWECDDHVGLLEAVDGAFLFNTA